MKLQKPDFMEAEYRNVQINVVDVDDTQVRKYKRYIHNGKKLIDGFDGVAFHRQSDTPGDDIMVIVPMWSIDYDWPEENKDITYQVRQAIDAAHKPDDSSPSYCYVVRYEDKETKGVGILVDSQAYDRIANFSYQDLQSD